MPTETFRLPVWWQVPTMLLVVAAGWFWALTERTPVAWTGAVVFTAGLGAVVRFVVIVARGPGAVIDERGFRYWHPHRYVFEWSDAVAWRPGKLRGVDTVVVEHRDGTVAFCSLALLRRSDRPRLLAAIERRLGPPAG